MNCSCAHRVTFQNSIFSFYSGLFPAILGQGPWPKLGKNDELNIKIGRNYDMEHNKGSKIYPQNQVIIDCIMASIQIKHKCLMGHFFSRKKGKKKIFFFFLLFLFGKNRHGIGEKRWLFSFGNGAEIRPLEKGRKSPVTLEAYITSIMGPDQSASYRVYMFAFVWSAFRIKKVCIKESKNKRH